MANTDKTTQEKVAQAACLMDKIVPGWYKAITPERLRMDNSQLCMLGQVFGIHIEKTIVKKVYAKEYAEALQVRKNSNSDLSGYGIGSGLSNYRGGLVKRIMRKLGIEQSEKASYLALEDVCSGNTNTKCAWVDEIATRLAQEQEASPRSEGSCEPQVSSV